VREERAPLGQLAGTYEQSMRGALGDLRLQREEQVQVLGQPALIRYYTSYTGGMNLGIGAVFCQADNHSYVLHVIASGKDPALFVPYLKSIRKAGGGAANAAAAALGGKATPGERQEIPGSGHSVEVPAGWAVKKDVVAGSLNLSNASQTLAVEMTWSPNDATGMALADLAAATLEAIKAETGLSPLKEQRKTSGTTGSGFRIDSEYAVDNGSGLGLFITVLATQPRVVVAYGFSAPGVGAGDLQEFRRVFSSIGGAGEAKGPTPKANAPSVSVAENKAPAKASKKVPAVEEADYLGMVVEDSGFEFQYPADFKLVQKSDGQTQWADPNAESPKIVMVIQTMMKSAGNSWESVFEGILRQVNGSPAARLGWSEKVTLPGNGMQGFKLHFTLDQGSHQSLFYYLVLNLRGPNVATVSFVGPKRMESTLFRHYQRLLDSVRERPLASSSGGSTVPIIGVDRPSTSQATWEALNRAARDKDWAVMVEYLEPDALRKNTLNYAERICRENGTDPDQFPVEPRQRLLSILQQVPQAEECVRYLQRPVVKITRREENADMHLIMVQYDAQPNHQQYYWMKRINGHWLHTPN